MSSNQNNIIVFDGVCNLCNSVVKFIIKRDKKAIFKFAALQSDFGKQMLILNDLPISEFDTFIYLRKAKILNRSTAALYVMKDLGGFYKLLFIGIIFPKFIRNFFYNFIAHYRYKIWGRKDSCMIPTEDISERFIE